MPYFLLLSIILLSNIFAVTPAVASTDPINATVSATATVPTTTATTSDTTAPTPVILVSPSDHTITGVNRPELVWKQTSDPNGNSVFYTVYLNGVTEYLGVSNTGNSQKNNYISRISDNQILLTPTHDLKDGTYTWMVAAYDLSNNTSYSTTWNFTVDTTPPPITLINIDDLYYNPEVIEGSIFDLSGPQDVTLTFVTEPWATISLNLTLPDGTTSSVSIPTNATGIATTTLSLPLGLSQILATSFDGAGHTSVYPTFVLRLESLTFAGLISLSKLPPITIITNYIPIIELLPATISQIQAIPYISMAIYMLLAMAILGLLILIWNRKYNILILDSRTQKPFRSLIVYHSRPTHSAHFTQTIGRILITNKTPLLYEVDDKGKIYIRHLGHYSTLTIRTPDGSTHILSLSKQLHKYTLVI